MSFSWRLFIDPLKVQINDMWYVIDLQNRNKLLLPVLSTQEVKGEGQLKVKDGYFVRIVKPSEVKSVILGYINKTICLVVEVKSLCLQETGDKSQYKGTFIKLKRLCTLTTTYTLKLKGCEEYVYILKSI